MKSLIAFAVACAVSVVLVACGEPQAPKQPEVKGPAPVPMHEQVPGSNTKHMDQTMPEHTTEHPDTNSQE